MRGRPSSTASFRFASSLVREKKSVRTGVPVTMTFSGVMMSAPLALMSCWPWLQRQHPE